MSRATTAQPCLPSRDCAPADYAPKSPRGYYHQCVPEIRAPLLPVESDIPHLITPVQSVHARPPGRPIAICTQLGWFLPGPAALSASHLEPAMLDSVGFKLCPAEYLEPTLRNICKASASQYCQLACIIPFRTRVKVLTLGSESKVTSTPPSC